MITTISVETLINKLKTLANKQADVVLLTVFKQGRCLRVFSRSRYLRLRSKE